MTMQVPHLRSSPHSLLSAPAPCSGPPPSSTGQTRKMESGGRKEEKIRDKRGKQGREEKRRGEERRDEKRIIATSLLYSFSLMQ